MWNAEPDSFVFVSFSFLTDISYYQVTNQKACIMKTGRTILKEDWIWTGGKNVLMWFISAGNVGLKSGSAFHWSFATAAHEMHRLLWGASECRRCSCWPIRYTWPNPTQQVIGLHRWWRLMSRDAVTWQVAENRDGSWPSSTPSPPQDAIHSLTI